MGVLKLPLRLCLGGPPPQENQLIAVRQQLVQSARTLVGLDSGPNWQSPSIRSFRNRLVFSSSTVFSDLLESSYPGYDETLSVLSWNAGTDHQGNAIVCGPMQDVWRCTGDPAGELLAGVYLWDGATNLIISGCSLEHPISLSDGLIIEVSIIYQIGNSSQSFKE